MKIFFRNFFLKFFLKFIFEYSWVNLVVPKNWGAYFSAISGRKFDLTTVLRSCLPQKWRRRGLITIFVTFVMFLNCLQAHRLFSCGFLLKVAKMDFSGSNHRISTPLHQTPQYSYDSLLHKLAPCYISQHIFFESMITDPVWYKQPMFVMVTMFYFLQMEMCQ